MSSHFQLTNPDNRSEFFKLASLQFNDSIRQLEGYTILLITEGMGKVILNDCEFTYSDNTMLCLSPYEPFKIINEVKGYQLTFHPDFLCVYKHHTEVACNGVLFDSIYSTPLIALENGDMNRLLTIIDQMKNEFTGIGLAKQEILISLLKIFLITATRMKVSVHPIEETKLSESQPIILVKLKDALEKYYREKHTPRAYAELLSISTKSLSRLTRTYFNKKPGDLIADRIFIEAKRELYLTSKSVKEIAYSLGFKDEFYFSRFFKNKAKVSPQRYRDTIGFAKMEMASGHNSFSSQKTTL